MKLTDLIFVLIIIAAILGVTTLIGHTAEKQKTPPYEYRIFGMDPAGDSMHIYEFDHGYFHYTILKLGNKANPPSPILLDKRPIINK